MPAAVRIDQLSIDAHAAAQALHAPLKDILHVQLTPNILHIGDSPPIGHRRAASDYERLAQARKICRQILDYRVREILVIALAA